MDLNQQPMEIQIKQKVSGQELSHLLVGAIEGGSNYWYGDVRFDFPDRTSGEMYDDAFARCIDAGLDFNIHFDTEDGIFILNTSKVVSGCMSMARENSEHWSDFINDNHDAITADVWLQHCLFNEVVYG